MHLIWNARQHLLIPPYVLPARFAEYCENPKEAAFFNFITTSVTSTYKELMLGPTTPTTVFGAEATWAAVALEMRQRARAAKLAAEEVCRACIDMRAGSGRIWRRH